MSTESTEPAATAADTEASSSSSSSSSASSAEAESAMAEVAAGGCGGLPSAPLSAADRAAAPPLRAAWQPAAAPVITLYRGKTSQPSRAVYQMLIERGLPFKLVDIDIRKNEQKSLDYLAHVNPAGLVPTIHHADRFIPESLDILHYLATLTPDATAVVAPSAATTADADTTLVNCDGVCGTPLRKSVEEWLAFSANEVRPVLTGITRSICLSKDAALTSQLRAQIPPLLTKWEAKLAARVAPDDEYVCTSDKAGPSIADFHLLHELNGAVALGVVELTTASHPHLHKWLLLMEARPASKKASSGIGLMFGIVSAFLLVKKFFGSKTGTL